MIAPHRWCAWPAITTVCTALAVAGGGCASGPVLSASASHTAANGDFSLAARRLSTPFHDDVVVETDAVATTPVAVERVSLSPAAVSPCGAPATDAATLSVDGAPVWRRPVALAGARHLRVELPSDAQVDAALEGAAALDVAFQRAGTPGCLRIALVDEGGGREWRMASRWMVGVRIGAVPAVLGLRLGRWLGPILAGIEGAAGPARASALVLAESPIAGGIAFELGAMGWWELSGTDRSRGSFRYGPRGSLHLLSVPVRERLGGMTVAMSSLAIGAARWGAADGETAKTEVTVDLTLWWSPHLPESGF